MATECNNKNKELYSRPAILEVILNEFGQKPISFLELLGDGTGAEFYATWLNINNMILIERDKVKFENTNLSPLLSDKCEYYRCYNKDLNNYFNDAYFGDGLDIVNLDFCTFLYDNNKPNCTAYCINKMFEAKVVKDDGLVFFTFMVTGIGVNMHKIAIKERDHIFNMIQEIALINGYNIEEKLVYFYKSSKPTTMINLGIKVKRIL